MDKRSQTAASAKDLEERLRFETLLSEISARFINLPADQIGSGIEDAQRRICELLGLDRSTLWQATEGDPGAMRLTHWRLPPGGPAPAKGMDARQFFPWTTQKVRDGEPVIISKLTDFPPEAGRDLESFRAYDTKSTVLVPLSVGEGPVFGLLGFAVMREERRWTKTEVTEFKLIAQVFANALNRKYIEENLRESEERFRVTFEQAAVGIAHVSPDGKFLRINRKFCEIVGYPREETLERTFQDITYPEDLAADLAQVNQLLSGKIATYSMEKRYIRKDGELVWVNLTVALVREKIRPFTPAIFPFLYAVMVPLEAPLSGTSTNPARSFGPAVISGQWQGWWIYWIGPLAGMLLAVIACSMLAKRIEVAKLYHFDSDRDRLFRRMAGAQVA